jgi:hypothetical protein
MGATLASFFGAGLWAVIKAALILLVAFIVARIVSSLVVKLLGKANLGSSEAVAEHKDSMIAFVGKLVYLLVFLLFVPGIFESLGMSDVSSPILSILNTMWGYLPNIVAAAIILWVGLFIAKLVRELLVPVFNKLNLNSLQEKAGIEVPETAKLSNTLAYIVYVLILIPVAVTALQVLNIDVISAPAIKVLDIIFAYIPNILSALLIILIGIMVAKLCGNIVESLIASSGLDAKLAHAMDGQASRFVLSKAIGAATQIVLVLFFVVESLNVLKLEVISGIGTAIIAYLPYVLAAVLILVACYLVNAMVQKALTGHRTAALFSQYAIYTVGAFMVLSELGIAQNIVNTAFILIVAAFAVAFAVSFGIGGRDFAHHTLEKFEAKCDKKDEQ